MAGYPSNIISGIEKFAIGRSLMGKGYIYNDSGIDRVSDDGKQLMAQSVFESFRTWILVFAVSGLLYLSL